MLSPLMRVIASDPKRLAHIDGSFTVSRIIATASASDTTSHSPSHASTTYASSGVNRVTDTSGSHVTPSPRASASPNALVTASPGAPTRHAPPRRSSRPPAATTRSRSAALVSAQ